MIYRVHYAANWNAANRDSVLVRAKNKAHARELADATMSLALKEQVHFVSVEEVSVHRASYGPLASRGRWNWRSRQGFIEGDVP